MKIDGRAIAHEVLASVHARAKALQRAPTLSAIAIAPTPATESYLAIKKKQAAQAGVDMSIVTLKADASEREVVEAVMTEPSDAVLVQLPLPHALQTELVIEAIPPARDADVLSRRARSEHLERHPIVASVRDILARTKTDIQSSTFTVIGQGWLVGAPVSAWLAAEGADVHVVTKETGGLEYALSRADVVISGAGSPGIVGAELLKEGVVLIDVGTSELEGSIAGDIAPEALNKARFYTPVPGGVGPLAVAYLMDNVVAIAEGTF